MSFVSKKLAGALDVFFIAANLTPNTLEISILKAINISLVPPHGRVGVKPGAGRM